MNNRWTREGDNLIRNSAPIHWSTVFGQNVKLSHFIVIDEFCIIGDNVFIGDFTKLRTGTKIGNNSIIGNHVISEGFCEIGENTTVMSFCGIGLESKIGNNCWIGPQFQGSNSRILCHGRPHLKDKVIKYRTPYIIGDGVRIGFRVSLMPGVKIGHDTLIYACSMVTKDIPPRAIVKGFPAKIIGEVKEKDCLYDKKGNLK